MNTGKSYCLSNANIGSLDGGLVGKRIAAGCSLGAMMPSLVPITIGEESSMAFAQRLYEYFGVMEHEEHAQTTTLLTNRQTCPISNQPLHGLRLHVNQYHITSPPNPEPGLPPSLHFARQVTEQLNLDRYLLGSSASPTPELASIRRKRERIVQLQKLGRWLASRHGLADPVVGEEDTDPYGVADEYGIKGYSVYSAFFDHRDMETFTCHACPHRAASIAAALAHQQIRRHFQI